MHFRFTINATDAPRSGLDLGNLEVSGPSRSVSSAPHMAFWVYPSIPDLVRGLMKLADGGSAYYRFMAPNSPFAVVFQRKRATIRTKALGVWLGTEPIPDVLHGLHVGVDALARERPLAPTDRYAPELHGALAVLRSRG